MSLDLMFGSVWIWIGWILIGLCVAAFLFVLLVGVLSPFLNGPVDWRGLDLIDLGPRMSWTDWLKSFLFLGAILIAIVAVAMWSLRLFTILVVGTIVGGLIWDNWG